MPPDETTIPPPLEATVPIAAPPETPWNPPESIVALATPPLKITSNPPNGPSTTVPVVVPAEDTVRLAPLETTVAIALPPDETAAPPPLEITVPIAVPPDMAT
jgi:hypothetical protein